jgi:hypothetical protein
VGLRHCRADQRRRRRGDQTGALPSTSSFRLVRCAMDDHRFDTLARALAERDWSRRRLALTLVSSAIALLFGWSAERAEAKKKKRKNKKRKKKSPCTPSCAGKRCGEANGCGGSCTCGECRVCLSGACFLAPDGTACGECGQCTNGTCYVSSPEPCGSCATCHEGTCVPKAPNTSCYDNDLARCYRGQCIPSVFCAAFPAECTTGDGCCSRACCSIPGVPGVQYCCRSTGGQPCRQDADCIEGFSCVGYYCRGGTSQPCDDHDHCNEGLLCTADHFCA